MIFVPVTTMKAALFSPCTYAGPTVPSGWPVPATVYSSAASQQTFQTAIEHSRLADELGFDWVTVAEHHFTPFCITPNPMVLAGALTQVVRRAKIALLGANIPILNPVRVAEEFAMLDVMSGGRLIAGMLRGTPNEYVTYNVNPSESRARFAEALQLIRRAWTEPEPFGWQGRYWQYKSISIWPRPVQQPHPPIYMSGSSPESGEFAAKNRLGLGFAVTSLALASKAARHYREQAALVGFRPKPEDVIYRIPCYVAESDDRAMEDLAAAQAAAVPRSISLSMSQGAESAIAGAGYYGRDDSQRGRVAQLFQSSTRERIEHGQILLGSPRTVLAQIRRIHEEVGAGVLDLVPGLSGEKAVASIERFGREILPAIREMGS
jgi:alkanesulfonate monooxygenase SsuD/methylene tetrahydromethanopterin reductase-like flavin-dependent oxidoreductase (luciferase family)